MDPFRIQRRLNENKKKLQEAALLFNELTASLVKSDNEKDNKKLRTLIENVIAHVEKLEGIRRGLEINLTMSQAPRVPQTKGPTRRGGNRSRKNKKSHKKRTHAKRTHAKRTHAKRNMVRM
jgi:hypothetical protein